MLKYYQIYYFTPEGVRCFINDRVNKHEIEKELSIRLKKKLEYSHSEKADFPANNLIFKDNEGNEHKVRVEKLEYYDIWSSPILNVQEVINVTFEEMFLEVELLCTSGYSNNRHVSLKSEPFKNTLRVYYEAIKEKQKEYLHFNLDLSNVFNLLGEGEMSQTREFYRQVSDCLGYERVISLSEEFDKHIKTEGVDSSYGGEYYGS